MIVSGLIVIFAFFCESIFGFGGGLISIPLLSVIGDVKNAVLFVLIFQLLMGIIAYKNLQHADWLILKKLGLGILIGVILGSLNLQFASDEILRKILGFAVGLVLIKSLFFPKLSITSHSKLAEIFVGIIGGYLQGVIGTGGPVFTMYLINKDLSKDTFRAVLMVIFFLTSVFRFIYALVTEPVYPTIIFDSLPAIPFFIFALFIGNHISGKIPEKYFKYFIHVLHLITCLSLLLKG